MARRKQEIALQQEIETQADWDSILSKEGLIVADVYQQWSGPCKAIEGIFRKLKLDSGDALLKFATAKADKIDSLENYRGRCEPCFLFYAAKELVAVVRGANAPKIIKTIQEQLAYEHKVLKGEAQRKPIVDPYFASLENQKKKDVNKAKVDHLIHAQKEVTICIIKPDIIEQNKKEEVIQKIKERGYEILEEKEIKMSVEQAKEFYKHKADSPQFDDLVNYMTRNTCCILAITKGELGENVIDQWRNDIGPTDIEEAKTANPDSLRAQYGTDNIMNAIHGSDSKESASKELAFFFPNLQAPQINGETTQRTLALIRPSAYQSRKDEIIKKIEERGFKIAMKKSVKLTKEQAEEFYSEHRGKSFYENLVTEMSSGFMMVLCLVKDNAINAWRDVLGPKEKDKIQEASGTLRHEFDIPTAPVNSLHGPSNEEQAEKELNFFFPMEQTLALLKPGLSAEKQKNIEKRIVDSGFLIAAKKNEKLSIEIVKEIYKDAESKPYYNDLVNLMTNGETGILVLSREDAIDGWREFIGPVDPNKAKLEKPDSLRAIFGENILQNVVHGPSNKEQAEREIRILFGDVSFDKKGKLVPK